MAPKRAAHFLLIPELYGSPPNDALLGAYTELGLETDVYMPAATQINMEGICKVEYGKRWIARNILSPRWRKYSLFSGTSEDPMAIVGLLSYIYRKPSITLADEIRSGSYAGNAPRRWKNLCKWGMKHSSLTVVNDENRVQLQRDYARLNSTHPIVVYPGCFENKPQAFERADVRREYAIPPDSLVLCYSGVISQFSGAEWMMFALEAYPELHVMGQIVNLSSLERMLLSHTKSVDRLHLAAERLSWRSSWSSMSAADIGMVIYHQDGPQFQKMGISSNRLCMFLSMGVPVIASYQPSFEFIEQYDCGILVKTKDEFVSAFIKFKADSQKCGRTH